MRLFVSVIASAAMLFAASTASAAVSYTAVTSVNGVLDADNSVDAAPGDIIDIAITLLSDGETVFGLGASATGYDSSVVSFVDGAGASPVLVQVCIPGVGCFGGVDNQATSPFESNANPLGPQVRFVNGVSTTGSSFTGATDAGFDGTPGGAQFRLTFEAAGPGSTTIVLDALESYGDATLGAGGATLVTAGDSVTVNVIPEPGTALLMGLGLAGLAAAGRRD